MGFLGSSKPTEETLQTRRSHAGAMAGVEQAMAAIRERGGLVNGPHAQGMFHWRLREPDTYLARPRYEAIHQASLVRPSAWVAE